MTNYCIPMRSINGDRKVGSKEWRSVFRAFFNNGIFPNPSTNFQVLENGNMTTRVGQGIAFVNGVFVMEDTDLFFEHDLADAVLKRIDSIVIRLDDVARTIKPVLIKGTPSSAPVPPTITRTADRWEIVLAYVFIDAGAVEITQADISDTRLDTELCGIVSGAVDQVDTTTIFNQYESWFNSVKDGTEQEIEDWQQLQYQNFLDWFATIQDTLDGDVAANLASQIAQTNNNLTLLGNEVASHLAQYDEEVGDVAQLETVNKNVVAAINEVKQIGNNVKADVVDELLLINPSLPLDNESTWRDIIDTLSSGQLGGGIKSIQKIDYIWTNSTNTNTYENRTITIDTVDMSKSIVLIKPYAVAGYPTNNANRIFARATITQPNTVTIGKQYGDTNVRVGYEITVIEFEKIKSIQKGQYAGSGGVVTISSIVPEKSLVISSFCITANYSGYVLSELPIVKIQNTNQLSISNPSSYNSIFYQVIEFE